MSVTVPTTLTEFDDAPVAVASVRQEPATPAYAELTIDELDGWGIPAFAAVSPTTISWAEIAPRTARAGVAA